MDGLWWAGVSMTVILVRVDCQTVSLFSVITLHTVKKCTGLCDITTWKKRQERVHSLV